MKKFNKIVLRRIKGIGRFFLKNISTWIYAATPYLTVYICYQTYLDRGYFAIGGEMILPLIPLGIAALIDDVKDTLRISKEIPIPRKRFTSNRNGNITIKNEDIFEIVEYLHDLENELERRGYIDVKKEKGNK